MALATIKQHRPGYFTGYEDKVESFNSLNELLSIGFVENFKKTPELSSFHQFSISEPSEDTMLLMAEYEEGKVWWVVGYLSNAKEIVKDLPAWVPKRD